MNGLVTLNKPPASSGPPTSSEIRVDELQYPNFRLLNRQTRATLSSSPFDLDTRHSYRLLAISNLRGWFTAVINVNGAFSLICSPLADLREAATSGSTDTLKPSRKLDLGSVQPRILSLACDDARLLISFASGELRMYDTSYLFSAGAGSVDPAGFFQVSGGSPVRQIAPNPNPTDESLAALVAVLYEDSRVVVYNTMNAQSTGGWMPGESARPAAIVWSPKGKQLAIGLQTGDIVTFTLADKSNPQKHIPPTASGTLVSLDWLSPGFTFKTTYASDDPQHHIVALDHTTSKTSFISLIHPFPLPDRPQNGTTIILSTWPLTTTQSTLPSVPDISKALLIVADACSTDIEVLGIHGTKWDQRGRDDNAIAIPLDKNYDDTTILALDVDLTSTSPVASTLPSGEAAEWPPAPILYAYLNDGTLQAWHIAQAKAYSGMITPTSIASSANVDPPSLQDRQMSTTADATLSDMTMHPETSAPAFQQPSAFGQPAQPVSSFGQVSQSSSPFGQQSAFSVPAEPTPVFGQSQPTSAFGQLGTSTSLFGQQSSPSTAAFGQTSMAAPQSAFGQTSFGQAAPKPEPGFGAFASSGASAFGSSGFGFVGGAASSAATNSQPAKVSTEDMQTESASSTTNETPATQTFGDLSLGTTSSDNDASKAPAGGMFGTTATTPATGMSPFGGSTSGSSFVKPATGFGAFSNFGESKFGQNAFGQASFGKSAFGQSPTTNAASLSQGTSGDAAKPANTSAFSSLTSSPQPAFGQSSFGQPSFGQSGFRKPVQTSAFGQPSFGQSAFGQPGFGQSAFAKQTIPSVTSAPSSGGFSAFAQGGASAFGASSSAAASAKSAEATPDTVKTGSPFTPSQGVGTAVQHSPFAPTSSSAFGAPETPATQNKSPFTPPSATSSPESPGQRSNAPSPGHQSPPSTPQPQPPTSQFPSMQIKPAAGFGAFGSDAVPKTSPFFSANKTSSLPVSAFGNATTPTKPFSTTPATTPTFGSTSSLGFGKSAFGSAPSFTPVSQATTPATGGFGAFSQTPSPFTAFAGPQKSFKDLLQSSPSVPDPEKPKTSASSRTSAPATPVVPSQAPSPPKETTETPTESDTTAALLKETTEQDGPQTRRNSPSSMLPSTTPSLSSSSVSSYVDVPGASAEEPDDEGAESEPGTDGEEESFLSESFESDEGSTDEEASLPDEEASESDEGLPSLPSSSRESSPPPPAARSPSMTPKAEPPVIRLSKSPTPKPEILESLDPESSTTPPGSPEKSPSPHPSTPLPAPTPVVASASSMTLGAGRPNTRPTRSSPLAKAPVSGEDESEGEDSRPVFDPVPLKPRPASPKGSFGDLPAASKLDVNKDTAGKLGRPNTPPLLTSTFGFGSSKKAPANAEESSPPKMELNLNLFGNIPVPKAIPITKKAAAAPQSASPFGTFGTPALFSPKQPTMPAATPSGSSPFMLGGVVNTQIQPPSFKVDAKPEPSTVTTPPTPVPRLKEPTVEEGMQAECMFLFASLAKELEDLKILAQTASKSADELRRPSRALKTDLRNPSKLAVNDAREFGEALKRLALEVVELKAQRDAQREAVRDIQGDMLKAGTRMEEIVRFNNAKTDAEFTKMLNSRTLGPEHYETQTQLRKDIQIIRDRIVKLETHLALSKKKLGEASRGKPVIRAPSLVTVNRTFKNIDIAIAQLSKDMSELSIRTGKLAPELNSSQTSKSQTSHSASKRPFNVTPHVAVTTAAALNAERSAQKLKKRLLSIRKEPLLNTRAASGPKAPIAFSTPNKATSNDAMALPGLPTMPTAPSDFDDSPSASFPTRRGATFTSKRPKSVPLKKSHGEPSSPSPAFDWGPLPTFPPLKSIATPIITKQGS
ncbi:hypothetical protein HGRIS_003650 [Hohenbuehelia grisea]|uniref:Nucleoporin Nup159/Nup146 N-terminal domain-containing protein n=1 Tax=Hohenbuehelia grisea TaxID=104357 RepID=A0ABR3JHP4_9AGAR